MTSESARHNVGGAACPISVMGAIAGLVVAVLVVTTDARAAPSDQPYPVGELASTMGGAAVAVTHDGTAPWYNQAGLGRVTEEGVSATLNVYGVQIERTKAFADGLDLAGTKIAIFPGSVGYVKPLGVFGKGIHHAIGLALVVPDVSRSLLRHCVFHQMVTTIRGTGRGKSRSRSRWSRPPRNRVNSPAERGSILAEVLDLGARTP